MSTTKKAVARLENRSVIDDMAARFQMDRAAFEATLKKTILPESTSNEQLAAFLIVAKQYDLNPFTKEIFGFPARGGIQPVVSIDGWLKIINDNPNFDGMEFEDRLDDENTLVSVTCRIYRSDRARPIEVTEYMAECRRETDTWKKWPARMLRHKATIQGARYAFGLAGIYDPDEAERLREIDVTPRAADAPRAAEGESKATEAQVNLIRNKLEQAGLEESALLEAIEADALESMPFGKVNDALAYIKEQSAK